MNADKPHRKYRFIEALVPHELKRSGKSFALITGGIELAERLSPNTPKAICEGDYLVRLADGSTFKEVSFIKVTAKICRSSTITLKHFL